MQKVERPIDLVESVKNALFDAILTGKLQPGEKLQQEMLAEKLGVSRQPVSHAMRILVEQGILTNFDSKSLTVTELEPSKMMQIFDVRIELESFAAMLAAQRSANRMFDQADHEILAGMNELIQKNRGDGEFNVKQSVHDDIQFHFMIRQLSGNPYIHETLSPHLLHHNRLMYLVQSHNDPAIWKEHAEISRLIEQGDEVNAPLLVRRHIQKGADLLQEYWRTQNATVSRVNESKLG